MLLPTNSNKLSSLLILLSISRIFLKVLCSGGRALTICYMSSVCERLYSCCGQSGPRDHNVYMPCGVLQQYDQPNKLATIQMSTNPLSRPCLLLSPVWASLSRCKQRGGRLSPFTFYLSNQLSSLQDSTETANCIISSTTSIYVFHNVLVFSTNDIYIQYKVCYATQCLLSKNRQFHLASFQ